MGFNLQMLNIYAIIFKQKRNIIYAEKLRKSTMSDKKTSLFSKAVFGIFSFFAKIKYRRVKIHNASLLDEENTIVIANHAQLNGPIIAQLHLDERYHIWANWQMFFLREVPSYTMRDFFPYKSGWTRPFYKIASYLLAPLMPCMMKNARAVPVYHDVRMASTVKNTLRLLSEGRGIVIFPEKHERHNNILNAFESQFVNLAKVYYRRTGERIRFLPMYIAPDLDGCYFGDAVYYDPDSDIEAERQRISAHLSGEITRVARELPLHTVIPFDNISSRRYLSNKDTDKLPL